MDVGVPVVTVFLQGFLSFFSPCVLPLVPLYLGFSQEAQSRENCTENGGGCLSIRFVL